LEPYENSFHALASLTGIHPYEAKSWDELHLNELSELLKDSECVAIGECGLDYTKDFSPQDIQKVVFEKQVFFSSKSSFERITEDNSTLLRFFSYHWLVK